MKINNLNDVLLTGGGIIPDEDMKTLYKQGVGKLFGPGATVKESLEYTFTICITI